MPVEVHGTRGLALPMVALSVALHGAAWAAAARVRPPPARAARVELEVLRRAPELRAAPPAPPPPHVAAALPRAIAARPAPSPAPAREPAAPASAPQALPPPDAARVLPRVGISLGSTVSAGAFAVGVGNTVHGRASESAPDPAGVRTAGPVVAAGRLSAQPRILDLPRIPYPPEARRAGVEGQVVLVLRLDAHGGVRTVRVVDAPSPDLARAAEAGARRFRFTPALLEGEPVETEIRFSYTFLLE